MGKRFWSSLILAAMLTTPVFSANDGVVTLDKDSVEKPELAIDTTTKQLQGSLLVNDSETLAKIIDEQKEHDIKDLEKLWQGYG